MFLPDKQQEPIKIDFDKIQSKKGVSNKQISLRNKSERKIPVSPSARLASMSSQDIDNTCNIGQVQRKDYFKPVNVTIGKQQMKKNMSKLYDNTPPNFHLNKNRNLRKAKEQKQQKQMESFNNQSANYDICGYYKKTVAVKQRDNITKEDQQLIFENSSNCQLPQEYLKVREKEGLNKSYINILKTPRSPLKIDQFSKQMYSPNSRTPSHSLKHFSYGQIINNNQSNLNNNSSAIHTKNNSISRIYINNNKNIDQVIDVNEEKRYIEAQRMKINDNLKQFKNIKYSMPAEEQFNEKVGIQEKEYSNREREIMRMEKILQNHQKKLQEIKIKESQASVDHYLK